MSIATVNVTADREHARERYAAYLKHCRGNHTKREASIKDAYRELSRGKQVIDLKRTIAGAGVDDQNRPLLAAIRADASVCHYRTTWGPMFWDQRLRTSTWNARESRRIKSVLKMPDGSLPGVSRALRAIVPTVPPELRPKGQLRYYVTLWEADWEDAPIDPLLLRPLGGSLYSVVAAWDLTAVEQAALRGDFD